MESCEVFLGLHTAPNMAAACMAASKKHTILFAICNQGMGVLVAMYVSICCHITVSTCCHVCFHMVFKITFTESCECHPRFESLNCWASNVPPGFCGGPGPEGDMKWMYGHVHKHEIDDDSILHANIVIDLKYWNILKYIEFRQILMLSQIVDPDGSGKTPHTHTHKHTWRNVCLPYRISWIPSGIWGQVIPSYLIWLSSIKTPTPNSHLENTVFHITVRLEVVVVVPASSWDAVVVAVVSRALGKEEGSTYISYLAP